MTNDEQEIARLKAQIEEMQRQNTELSQYTYKLRFTYLEELNKRLRSLGHQPGELQALWRGFRVNDGAHPVKDGATMEEMELALLDAFVNMGGATAWRGDGSSCAAQIVWNVYQEMQKWKRAVKHLDDQVPAQWNLYSDSRGSLAAIAEAATRGVKAWYDGGVYKEGQF